MARAKPPKRRSEPRPIYTRVSGRRRRIRRQRCGRFPLTVSFIALCVVAILIVWAVAEADQGVEDAAHAQGVVEVIAGQTVVRADARRLASFSPARLERWLGRIPHRTQERRGRAVIRFVLDRRAAERQVRIAARAGGGTVVVPRRPVAANARLPIVRQALRNNCEMAALSMLLRVRGVRVGQLRLQEQLPRSGPLDPRPAGEATVWGDPRSGFVGRADGGGVAGGYGVYEGPVQELAKSHDVPLRDLSRRPPQAVYHRLLRGQPVLVWVGLSDGPYKTWETPSGDSITGNFGEHTVVLTGLRGDRIAVNDPLSGKRTSWTREQFELMWARLGRRALGA